MNVVETHDEIGMECCNIPEIKGLGPFWLGKKLTYRNFKTISRRKHFKNFIEQLKAHNHTCAGDMKSLKGY